MALPKVRHAVDILLLGRGWTAGFLLPLLRSQGISHACTCRKPAAAPDVDVLSSAAAASSTSVERSDDCAYPFHFDASTADSVRGREALREACAQLPRARMVVTIFPLPAEPEGAVSALVQAYEHGTGCTPAWLALGSTGAWGKGRAAASTTPLLASSARARAETALLAMHTGAADTLQQQRLTSVLHLAGLYGTQRNPANFAKRVADTKDKLRGKTSVHLVHGHDVARAIVGMYRTLLLPENDTPDTTLPDRMWGRRWIVTDTHTYDWWQLLTTLQPPPVPQGVAWVRELMAEHGIVDLPRPPPPPPPPSSSDPPQSQAERERSSGSGDAANNGSSSSSKGEPPYVLERVLDGTEFWEALGDKPQVGRCDDYGSSGGGNAVESSL